MYELAEASARFESLGDGEERLEHTGFDVFLAPGPGARACIVQRPRFEPEGIAATVERARCVLRSKGRHAATWEILSTVHPRSTLDHLLSLGMQWAVPKHALIVALSSAPAALHADVVVAEVDTLDRFKAHLTITHEVFGIMDRLPAELARLPVDGRQRMADKRFVRYIAYVDGVPAGAATATFTSAGVMLHSGSTLAPFRGRGVYGAMVNHRWHAAVARGTPELITRAGLMSRAIVARLGFRELGEMHFLVDHF